jgi:hypothetical protein
MAMKKDGVVKAMLSLVKANRGIVAAAVLALGGIGLLYGQDAADLAKYGIRRNEGDISMTQEQIEEADRYRREQWAIQQGQGNWVQVIKTAVGDVLILQLDGKTYIVAPLPKPNLEVVSGDTEEDKRTYERIIQIMNTAKQAGKIR